MTKGGKKHGPPAPVEYDITLDHVHHDATQLTDLSELVGGLLDASEVLVESDALPELTELRRSVADLTRRLEIVESKPTVSNVPSKGAK